MRKTCILWLAFVGLLSVPYSCTHALFVDPLRQPNQRASSTTLSVATGTTSAPLKELPPGRPTNRWIRFLFDDAATLLNPRDMKLLKRKHKFGPIFKTNFLLQPCVFVTDETSIQILAKQEAKKSLNAFFPPHHQKLFGSNSLLVTSGESHARIRRLVMSSMSPAMIKTYEPLLQTAITDLFQGLLKEQTENESFISMVPKLRRFFMSIILQVVLGTTDVSESLVEDLDIWSRGLLAPPLTFLPFTTAGRAVQARRRVVQQIEEIIQMHTQKESKRSRGLLAQLIHARDDDNQALTHDEIVDNLFTLVFAGMDTTASAAISIWMLLSTKPSSMDLWKTRLRQPEELEAFVDGILAAFPPAPFNVRQTCEELDLGDYRVPANWLVAYGFASALEGTLPPTSPTTISTTTGTSTTMTQASSSLAFGQGPRKCPGRYLASAELKMFTKALVEFEWEVKPDQNLAQTYTPGFYPVDGFQVKLMDKK